MGDNPYSPNFYGIVDPDYYYPMESDFYLNVLRVGEFYSDEVVDHAEALNWIGIFEGNDGYYVDDSKLFVENVFDQVLDSEEEELTAKRVSTLHVDSPIMFIESNELFSPHAFERAVIDQTYIFPGDTLRLNYLGIPYEIFATGNKERFSDVIEYFSVWTASDILDEYGWDYNAWNYKLYVSAIIEGKKCQNILAGCAMFDDHMIGILFGGDMDGDGILDLIIDTANKYNTDVATLYLSKPAGEGQVMKPVGTHAATGC